MAPVLEVTAMLAQLREEVCAANLALQGEGLVTLTWGNASGFDPESGAVVIKPSGVSYETMRPEHMVVVSLDDGSVLWGDLRPSSDTPTHLVFYREFAGIGGVVHTHSTHATAWAQARRPLPCYGTTHADHFYGEVPVTDMLTEAEIAEGYERQTGVVAVRALAGRDPLSMPAVLVAGHGPFTWGRTVRAAVENAVVLEEVARMAALTEALAQEARPIPRNLLDKHFLRKHGTGAYYGQADRKD
jgi:L-ribulose-5-phosphate 4-epimerase